MEPFGAKLPRAEAEGVGDRPVPQRRSVVHVRVSHVQHLPRKVDVRLPGKGNSKLPWRKAGPPNHLDDKVDSDQ